jgi:exosortase D (VPLPA-CTERM-specific)
MAFALVVAIVPFASALAQLYDVWNLQPEYSHAILIPAISLYLIWRERSWLVTTRFRGSWYGLILIALGLLMWIMGELSTLFSIVQYGFLLVVWGLVLSFAGWNVVKRLWMPLLMLLFMVPLPAFFMNTISLQLQLLSSAAGVALIRAAGISVFLQGNVIDLGTYKLEVAEACNGLRYLFPLMTLAFIIAYFFRAPRWKRFVLFFSSIPIAILMNSFRIGAIGVTVEYWGPKMAEGVLHDFEGWLVFMLSTGVLILVAIVLSQIGPSRTDWRKALAIEPSKKAVAMPRSTETQSLSPAFVVATVLTACAAAGTLVLPDRHDVHPPRAEFAEFPTRIGDWTGRRDTMDAVYRDALQFDDYLMADYRREAGAPINFYVAYYDSQRKGQSAHSPRSCLPGGGWIIRDFGQRTLHAAGVAGSPSVNRAVIEMGNQKQIVYYWFQERGRLVANEYLVKWFIFWDALTRNRTDGALVRLVASVQPNGTEADADAEITRFADLMLQQLPQYVPN